MVSSEIAVSTPPEISRLVLWTMTLATGLCVANLYYCQPLLHEIRATFSNGSAEPLSAVTVGWIPTLTQIGYALGMLFIVPLGDMKERRNLIFIFTLISAATLVGVSVAPSFALLALLSLLLGMSTTTPQFLIPFAAHLAPEKKRGEVVGTLMSGLLLGILLSRTVAGFVGSAFGWRVVFGASSILLFCLAFALRAILPKHQSNFSGSYLELLNSVYALVRTQPVLREAMIMGALLFASFSAFWVTLIHLLETPTFNLGARAVGLFGLVGAGAVLVAPLVGKMADRKSPRATTGAGIALTAFSFLVFWLWGSHSLIGLGIGVLLMDIGVQSGHIANQSRVFALIPEARSRLNTAYMFSYFLGGAFGSWLASLAWGAGGWSGVCAASLGLLAIAGVFYALNFPRS